MKKIPICLIIVRLFVGLLIVLLSILKVEHYEIIAIAGLYIGLLTDIFDGIIARKLNVSTQSLRRLDSTIDLVFFICISVATYLQCAGFFKENASKLIILFAAEGFTYVICFFKFKKEIATHTLGAKIWTLTLVCCLTEIILQCSSTYLFNICFWLGIATRLEIIGIILVLKKWVNDVPSIFHAIKLRNGLQIKRNKLFN